MVQSVSEDQMEKRAFPGTEQLRSRRSFVDFRVGYDVYGQHTQEKGEAGVCFEPENPLRMPCS